MSSTKGGGEVLLRAKVNIERVNDLICSISRRELGCSRLAEILGFNYSFDKGS